MGRQLEVYSAILMRSSSEESVHFDEPVQWEHLLGKLDGSLVLGLTAEAVGAPIVFVRIGLYHRLQRHQPISGELADRGSFAAAKNTLTPRLLAG